MKTHFTRITDQSLRPANPHGAAATERVSDDASEKLRSRAWKARLLAFGASSVLLASPTVMGADTFNPLSISPFSLSTESTSSGSVNSRTGEYSLHAKDRISASHSFEVRRSYRSRSVTSGLFGFGWCSDFEKRLEQNRDGSLSLKTCDTGASGFVFRQSSIPSVGKTTVDAAKNQNGSQKNRRRVKPRNNELAPHFANDPSLGRIETHPTSYLHILPDGSTESFSKDGHLLSFASSQSQVTSLLRNSEGRLIAIVLPDSRKIVATTDGLGRLISLGSFDAPKALHYQYEDGNLARVRSGKKTLHHYSYDRFRNLVLVDPADGSQETLAYFAETDRVHRHTSPACRNEWHYEDSKPNKKRVRLTRTCESRSGGSGRHPSRSEFVEEKFFEFDGPEGSRSTLKSKVEDSLGQLELESNSSDGRILSIKRNDRRLEIIYDESGRIAGLLASGEPTLRFHYHGNSNEPSKIAIDGRTPHSLDDMPTSVVEKLTRTLALLPSQLQPRNLR